MHITQIYPHTAQYQSIQDLYLDEVKASEALVYANFLTSLDGKIAIKQEGSYRLPEALANDNDLHLFMQLRAQADCILTHAGYMRSLASGKLGDIIRIEDKHILQWQKQNGLTQQALIVICSNSLDFPMPEFLEPQHVVIATSAAADPQRVATWRERGYRVIEAGDSQVRARDLQPQLVAMGLKRFYLCAGPQLFESYLVDAYLDRLYMTLSMQFLGYHEYLTTVLGLQEIDHVHLELRRMLIDFSCQPQQLFASFDCR